MFQLYFWNKAVNTFRQIKFYIWLRKSKNLQQVSSINQTYQKCILLKATDNHEQDNNLFVVEIKDEISTMYC